MAWLSDTILRLAGPVVPGELALVVGGVLAHQGRVPLWAAVVAGADGAVIGDSLGYAIGHGGGSAARPHPAPTGRAPPGAAGHGPATPPRWPGGVRGPLHAALLGFAAGPAWRTAERVAVVAGLVLLGVIAAGAAMAPLVRRRRSGRHRRPTSQESGRH
jgi:membrane protein DedA with SNARE-associated domain